MAALSAPASYDSARSADGPQQSGIRRRPVGGIQGYYAALHSQTAQNTRAVRARASFLALPPHHSSSRSCAVRACVCARRENSFGARSLSS